MKFSPKKALIVGVAATAGVMLCGATAFAGTPTTTPAHNPAPSHPAAKVKSGAIDVATVTLWNQTPYEWTLDDASWFVQPGQKWGDMETAPQQTLEPGQKENITTVLTALQMNPMYVQYNFTDVNGGTHIEKFQTGTAWANWADSIVICAADGNDQSSVFSTVFNTVIVRNGLNATIAAGLDGPAELTVDAQQHPAQAQAIMKQFAAAQPTTQHFNPHMITNSQGQTVPEIAYTKGTEEQITGEVDNETDRPVSVQATHQVDSSQSTTLGMTVGVEANMDILGIVNTSAALKATTDKSWGTTTSTSQAASLQLNPLNDKLGQTNGWITRTPEVATVTGDFDFTTNDGIIYHVKNVTVSEEEIDGATTPDGTHVTTAYGQRWTN